MKKQLFIITMIILLGLGSMAILHALTDMPNRKKNGFERDFLPYKPSIEAQQTFQPLFRELAGVHQGRFYLMGENPSLVYVLDEDLSRLDSIKLHLTRVPKFIPRFYAILDYPLIHLLGGNAHTLITAHLEKDSVSTIRLDLPGFFSNPVQLDSVRFMLQVIDSVSLDAYFVTMDRGGRVLQEEEHISARRGDAGFLSSGQLRRDRSSGMLTYMRFYDNQWISFGPEMHVSHRGHTLDTNAHIKTEIIRHGRNVNYRKPPWAVNAYSSVHQGVLSVRSKLRADNESRKAFRHHAVIDRYDIHSGDYRGSYRLPHPQTGEIQQFYCLDENRILALGGRTVTVFKLLELPGYTGTDIYPYDQDKGAVGQLPHRLLEPLQQISEQKGGIKP